jgi:hypothetical protein
MSISCHADFTAETLNGLSYFDAAVLNGSTSMFSGTEKGIQCLKNGQFEIGETTKGNVLIPDFFCYFTLLNHGYGAFLPQGTNRIYNMNNEEDWGQNYQELRDDL